MVTNATPAEFSPLPTTREERGREIAKLGGIRALGAGYVVPSQSVRSDARWELLGNAQVMQDLRRQIAKVAPTRSRVLITGESGTVIEAGSFAGVAEMAGQSEGSARRGQPCAYVRVLQGRHLRHDAVAPPADTLDETTSTRGDEPAGHGLGFRAEPLGDLARR